MAGYIGEFPCTIDAKGRFLLPVALKKQIPVKEQKQFVVHRGIEKHLIIYTKKVWDKISEEVNELNLYVRKNREFIRSGCATRWRPGRRSLILQVLKKTLCSLHMVTVLKSGHRQNTNE